MLLGHEGLGNQKERQKLRTIDRGQKVRTDSVLGRRTRAPLRPPHSRGGAPASADTCTFVVGFGPPYIGFLIGFPLNSRLMMGAVGGAGAHPA